MTDHVRIFDTTLRDGEQAPGCSMSPRTKVTIARQLARLGVDIVEAGFPAASPGEADAVRAVATEVGVTEHPTICGLSRANAKDIECCARAIAPAASARIHIFIATSDIHLQHKLRLSREQVLQRTFESISHARSLCGDVEFSAEDAARSDPGFLNEVFACALQAGARTLNAPDTVGFRTPAEYAEMIRRITNAVRHSADVVVSAHCHNDLGLAVANSLAAVQAGARQVECTVNGIGERAGNAALEEIVMALHTRTELFGVATTVDTSELMRTSRLVADSIGVPVPPNKAIVGANAFAHEAGIHQDGVLKNPLTYEIMSATAVGRERSELVLGKHSGRNALSTRIASGMGLLLQEEELTRVFTAFKALADRKRTVSDDDLWGLVRHTLRDGFTEPRAMRATPRDATEARHVPTSVAAVTPPRQPS